MHIQLHLSTTTIERGQNAWIPKSKQNGGKDQNTKCFKNSTEFPGVFSPFPFHYPQAWTQGALTPRSGDRAQTELQKKPSSGLTRKETPNAQREGNSCVSSLFSIISHPSS